MKKVSEQVYQVILDLLELELEGEIRLTGLHLDPGADEIEIRISKAGKIPKFCDDPSGAATKAYNTAMQRIRSFPSQFPPSNIKSKTDLSQIGAAGFRNYTIGDQEGWAEGQSVIITDQDLKRIAQINKAKLVDLKGFVQVLEGVGLIREIRNSIASNPPALENLKENYELLASYILQSSKTYMLRLDDLTKSILNLNPNVLMQSKLSDQALGKGYDSEGDDDVDVEVE